jgi:hypothetical protein
VENGLFQFQRNLTGIRVLTMPHHHRDFSAEMLFVKAERLLAFTGVVQIDVQFHSVLLSRPGFPGAAHAGGLLS